MMYTPDSITQIDFTKYKRLFAVGCSFTKYWWPSWADLLYEEIQPEFYLNAGQCGAGNSYISTVLNQITRKYSLTETDLVVVMWSTFYRADFYKDGNWTTPGNIYTQHAVPMDFVNDFYSVRGFYLRDLALIDNSVNFLQNQKFDSFTMWSVNPMSQPMYCTPDNQNFNVLDVIKLYEDLDNYVLPDLINTGMNGSWPTYFTYEDPHVVGGKVEDYHPCTVAYADYLRKIGIPLSDSTVDFASRIDVQTAMITHVDQFLVRPWSARQNEALL
jgi:hypothetical protein